MKSEREIEARAAEIRSRILVLQDRAEAFIIAEKQSVNFAAKMLLDERTKLNTLEWVLNRG